VCAAARKFLTRCWYQDPPTDRSGGHQTKGGGRSRLAGIARQGSSIGGGFGSVDFGFTQSGDKYSHTNTLVVLLRSANWFGKFPPCHVLGTPNPFAYSSSSKRRGPSGVVIHSRGRPGMESTALEGSFRSGAGSRVLCFRARPGGKRRLDIGRGTPGSGSSSGQGAAGWRLRNTTRYCWLIAPPILVDCSRLIRVVYPAWVHMVCCNFHVGPRSQVTDEQGQTSITKAGLTLIGVFNTASSHREGWARVTGFL
jgi:hypothetical protein